MRIKIKQVVYEAGPKVVAESGGDTELLSPEKKEASAVGFGSWLRVRRDRYGMGFRFTARLIV